MESKKIPEPYKDCVQFKQASYQIYKDTKWIKSSINFKDLGQTIVAPLTQLPNIFGNQMNTEYKSIYALLSMFFESKDMFWTFTSGYFNPESKLKLLLQNGNNFGEIITAGPHANSFYASSGLSNRIPDAYTWLLYLFARNIQTKKIKLCEWQKGLFGSPERWTYHAKGYGLMIFIIKHY